MRNWDDGLQGMWAMVMRRRLRVGPSGTAAMALGFFAALGLVGCHHHGRGYESQKVPGIRILAEGEVARLGLERVPFAQPFGEERDGTRLVLAFLESARARGAEYVSGLEIDIVTEIEGEATRCTTLVGPEAEVETRTRVVHKPGRMEQRQVLEPVTRQVTEYQYRCQLVSKPVTRYETTYRGDRPA